MLFSFKIKQLKFNDPDSVVLWVTKLLSQIGLFEKYPIYSNVRIPPGKQILELSFKRGHNIHSFSSYCWIRFFSNWPNYCIWFWKFIFPKNIISKSNVKLFTANKYIEIDLVWSTILRYSLKMLSDWEGAKRQC